VDRPQDEERMRSMEECAFCHGELEEKAILYTSEFEGRVVVVEHVPALVCRQCGETALRPEVVEKLQKIVWGELPETRTVRVPFYDFAEVG
jgi:YgiT-type zinc finger domain-containing protein